MEIIKTKYIFVAIFLLLIVTLSIESCRHDKNDFLIPEKKLNSNRDYYLDLYFPDTVNIKNTYEGKIVYKSPLDSITTDLFIKGDSMRILVLYLKDNRKHIKDDYKHILLSKEIDTFVPNSSDEIVFNFKFKYLGINYLEGVLEDKIYFKESDTSKLRIITKYNHVTLPVFVTDDDKLIDSYFKE